MCIYEDECLLKCGGISPVKKTDAMTQPVGQLNGKLYSIPGTGELPEYDEEDAGKFLQVNSDGDGLVWTEVPGVENTRVLFMSDDEAYYVTYLPSGAEIAAPSTNPTTTETGFEFSHWSETEGGDAVTFPYTVDENATLYAVYKKQVGYSVSGFQGNLAYDSSTLIAFLEACGATSLETRLSTGLAKGSYPGGSFSGALYINNDIVWVKMGDVYNGQITQLQQFTYPSTTSLTGYDEAVSAFGSTYIIKWYEYQ